MKKFLVICRAFSSAKIVGAIDKCPGVVAWSQIWPGAVMVRTVPGINVSVVEAHIHEMCPGEHFMAVEFSLNTSGKGWLDQRVWEFLQESEMDEQRGVLSQK